MGISFWLAVQVNSSAPLVIGNELSLMQCNILLFLLDLEPEFSDVDKTSPNCAVIGDAADTFSYQNLNNTFRALIAMETPVLFSMGRG